MNEWMLGWDMIDVPFSEAGEILPEVQPSDRKRVGSAGQWHVTVSRIGMTFVQRPIGNRTVYTRGVGTTLDHFSSSHARAQKAAKTVFPHMLLAYVHFLSSALVM